MMRSRRYCPGEISYSRLKARQKVLEELYPACSDISDIDRELARSSCFAFVIRMSSSNTEKCSPMFSLTNCDK